jgi:hypothetical protein
MADFHVQIANKDEALPLIEHCCMRAKDSHELLWTLTRQEGGGAGVAKYRYVDHVTKEERLEDGWEERFQEVWAMQCALDFSFYHHEPSCSSSGSDSSSTVVVPVAAEVSRST